MKPVQAVLFAVLVLGMFGSFSSASAQKPAGDPHRRPRFSAGRDTTRLVSANLDSLRQILISNGSARSDSIRRHAWRNLKGIGPAVALAPLDGPEDIEEKIEIIEDRMDALLIEKKKLERILEILILSRQSREIQIEVLEDVSDINRRSDIQRQQRLHDLQQQFNRISRRVRAFERSLSDLENELVRLQKLAKQYRKQAETLQKNEGRHP